MSKTKMRLRIADNTVNILPQDSDTPVFSKPFENTEGFEAWVLAGKWLVANNAYIPEDQMAGLMEEVKRSLRGNNPYKYEISITEISRKTYIVEGHRPLTLEEEEEIEISGINSLPDGFSEELEGESGEFPSNVDIMDISDENDES